MGLTIAQHPWAKNNRRSLLTHTEKMFIRVCDRTGCSAGQGLSAHVLSTPFKQGLRTPASKQPQKALEGSGYCGWQNNNKKKYVRPQNTFHLRAVGHLLHKGPVLGLTYLETEVAGSFASLRGAPGWLENWAPSTWIVHSIGESGHLDSSKNGASCGLCLLEGTQGPRGEDDRVCLFKWAQA